MKADYFRMVELETIQDSAYRHWITTMRSETMKLSEVFPSRYLRAADLNGKKHTLKISKVTREELGGERKLICHFEGKEKAMVVNKTKAGKIGALYGQETDDWVGHEIRIWPTKTNFKGDMVDAIDVEAPVRDAELNDDVPF